MTEPFLRLLPLLGFIPWLSTTHPSAPPLPGTPSQQPVSFQLRAQPLDEDMALRLRPVLERGVSAVEAYFGAPFAHDFTVVLHPDRASFDASFPPEWGLEHTECWMVATGVGDGMQVLSPRAWPAEACEHDADDALHVERLLTHELVHVYHGQHNPSPDFVDTTGIDWFVEGLAVLVSGQLADEQLASARTALEQGAGPDSLAKAWSGRYRYGVSGSLVAFVERKLGRERLPELLAATSGEELLAEIGSSEAELLADWRAAVLAQDNPLRVLFVGNSYTYFNNLPELLGALAKAGGKALETRMVAPGGWTLKDHFEQGEALPVLRGEHWDRVVLQEQSTLGSNLYVNGEARVGDDRAFRPWADRWAAAIAEAGARPVFYLTWARKKFPEDQTALNAALRNAARAAGAKVAPVGPAWVLAHAGRPALELYYLDGSHPSPAGSYLAACTLYATLFEASPVGLPARASGHRVDLDSGTVTVGEPAVLVELPEEVARALQEAAWAAHEELRASAEAPLPEATGAGLPPLPSSEPLTPKALEGTWKGSLRFYPTPPTDLTLFLEAPTAPENDWAGFLRLEFHSPDLADATIDFQDLAVGPEQLSFHVPQLPFDLDVRFRAVLLPDGTLSGQAEAQGTDAEAPLRLLGSWRLRKTGD